MSIRLDTRLIWVRSSCALAVNAVRDAASQTLLVADDAAVLIDSPALSTEIARWSST
ncbi:hypothetical protein [Curtobacterium sp. VKM Ac-2865]|uniref:hypothetical protein n=1 Tax=Curtobacterium sp. VKM Ac-2865 TaxID=2783817 RepID=UPI00188BEC3D|nr:hypothetical protein [Curtobacterium sp. VKM Ac-2865]